MPRPRKIWKRKGRDHFYAKIDGRQVRLELVAKGEAASVRKLEKILKGQDGPAAPGITFALLADRFLEHSQQANEAETYEVHRFFLQSFKDFVGGKRPVGRLCADDLDRWCRKQAQGGGKVKAGGKKGGERAARPWSENAQAQARAVVLACLNYGVNKLNMPPHPLARVKPGTVTRRERYLSAEERQTIRAKVKGCFAEFVLALEQTGARPFSEICKVEATQVDLEKGTWTLTKWKNSKKQKGKKRVIFLSDAMKELTRRLMKERPQGPLFRNAKGTPWSRQSITWRFRKLSEKLGLEKVTAYTFRHTAVSDALIRGVPVAVVAELYGTSIQTISRSYAHIDKREDVLAEAMRKALGG